MKKINIDLEELESNKDLLNEFNSINIEDTAKTITKSFTIDNNKINEIKNDTKLKTIDFNKLFLLDGDTSQDDSNIIDTEDPHHSQDN